MRHATRSRSTRRSGDEVRTSLFPFLAVLICTVGTLILLLVILGRHARLQAAEMAKAKKAETQQNLKEKIEDARWRIEQLQQSSETTQRQLVDARLELGHLEDHARQLRGRLESLEYAWRELERPGADPSDRIAVEAQLRELTARINQMKSRVTEARREAMAKQRSYAVVPYEGSYGTRRRPIYLECRANAVILQPEGIALEVSDFEGPLGPDNPLAAALRAAREYLLRAGQFDPKKAGEPYPLLLVRPLGIHSYYAAREAMSSWESDFGYEMIDEEWKLNFEPPDPELARVVREEVERARARQRRLAAAAPRYYRHLRASGGGDRPQYTVSGSGVVVPYGGDGSSEPTERRSRPGSRTGRWSPSSGRGNSALGGDGPDGLSTAAGRATSGGVGDSNTVDAGTAGSGGNGGRSGHGEGDGLGQGASGTQAGGPALASGENSLGGTTGGPLLGSPGAMSGNPSVDGMGGSPGGALGGRADAGGVASGQIGESESTLSYGMGAPRNGSAASGGSPEGSASDAADTEPRLGQWSPKGTDAGSGPPERQSLQGQSRRREENLAQKRGKDWALPDTSPTATPLTQPIRIECYPDRLVLVAQRGLSGGRSIALGPRTRDAIDELVSTIWSYTEGWGMAGNGMYWRPVLHVYVYGGAENRYGDVEELLQDSGLLMERKN